MKLLLGNLEFSSMNFDVNLKCWGEGLETFLAMTLSEYACIWLHSKSLFNVLMFCFSKKSLTSEDLKIPSLSPTSQSHSGSQYASTRCEITARVLVLPDKM